jgi:transcription initiation factor TFIID subunit 13
MPPKDDPSQPDFTKELRPMMYGFGDAPDPHPASVALVQDLTLSYLHNFLDQVQSTAQSAGSAKVRLEDVMFVLRKDKKKLVRVEELLFMNEELKKARKAFDVDESNVNDE